MATLRPVVTVWNHEDAAKVGRTIKAPGVFGAPLRHDLVQFIVDQMNMNRRQAYAVSKNAGYQTAAESWGTGRAVARIPRVPGGGTHRAGQAAFGNQCRGGGMFNPTKVWRKWHRKINTTQKRHACAAAIAASGVPALVMARGHRIDEVPELPLVVDETASNMNKTKEAVAMLKRMGLEADLTRVVDSRKIRAGKGKARNRRYVMRKGPLVVYSEDNGITKACRNIPGVDTCSVESLNLLKLAPGGHFGRAVVYTEGAFKKLNEVFGSGANASSLKKGYKLPRAMMTNPDLNRLINSDEIQSVLRPMRMGLAKKSVKKNPLKNKQVMALLNPGSQHRAFKRKQVVVAGTGENTIRARKVAALTKTKKAHNKTSTFFKSLKQSYAPKTVEAEASEE